MTTFRRGARVLAACVLAAIAGCGGDNVAPAGPRFDAEHGYWRLTLNHYAVTMSTAAPYDTIRVTATPRDQAGQPVPDAVLEGAVTTYRLADPSDTSLVVSPAGLVRARFTTPGSLLLVSTSAQGVTRTDTVVFNVTDLATPPRFAALSLQALPSDTLFVGNLFKPLPTLTPQALDADGNPIAGVPFMFWSGDSSLAHADRAGGFVTNSSDPGIGGRVMMYVTATIYGVTKTDSVPVIVTPPEMANIYIGFRTPHGSLTPVGYFDPEVITVRKGAMVVWIHADPITQSTNVGKPAIDVVFANPSAAELSDDPFSQFCLAGGSGNIAAFAPDSTKPCYGAYRIRKFTTPGTYPFHSARYGATGKVIVLP